MILRSKVERRRVQKEKRENQCQNELATTWGKLVLDPAGAFEEPYEMSQNCRPGDETEKHLSIIS